MIKLCGEYMGHRETKDVQEQKEFIISSFATLFYRVARDIESLGGTPDFSTMVVMFHKPEDFENIPGVLRGDREITLGIKMYGEFDND